MYTSGGHSSRGGFAVLSDGALAARVVPIDHAYINAASFDGCFRPAGDWL
jgi:hypothetical protein